MPGSRIQTVRQHLHISIDPYRPSHGRSESSPASTTSPGSSARASISTTCACASVSTASTFSTGPSTASFACVSEWVLFSVLCLHDFESNDPDHLSFHKNEILQIVKQEETGWWAAVRENGTQVGWIPSAFVAELEGVELEKLHKVRFDLRVYEYDAERLYNSAPISQLHHLYPVPDQSAPAETPGGGRPKIQDKSMLLVTPTDLIQQELPVLKRSAELGSHFAAGEVDSPASARFRVPPSPSTPIPRPPLTTAPLLINKPTPPTPVRSSSTSALDSGPPNRGITRSRSETASSVLNGRNLRRRPVLVDDRVSLSRLSTLMETNNMTEVEILTSPQMSGSFGAFSRVTGGAPGEASRPFAHDNDALNFYSAKLGQSHLPWYLRPSYDSDTLKVDLEGYIIAGTLPALVERLTVNPPAEMAQETVFRNTFLMTFRCFTSPERLFELLVESYQMDHPVSLSTEEFEEWKEKKLRPTQKRVLTILTMWLEDHNLLDEEPHVARQLTEFLSLIVSPEPLAITARLILESLERLTFAQPDSPRSGFGAWGRKKSKAHRNDLLKYHPDEIGEQLCLHEQKLYLKIRPQECLNWSKTQSGRSVANLIAFCATHEKLGAWVKMSILNTEVLGKRADVVDYWIKVAERCRFLHDYASMSAIITALSSTVITRLHLTWAHASRKSHLDAMLKFNEPSGGFSGYRSLLHSVDGPCVPFLTMFLTDLVHIQDQNPDTLPSVSPEEPLICFKKAQRWYGVVKAMLAYQSKPYAWGEVEPTKNFIEGQVRTASLKDQSWYWSKSQEVQQTELAHADIRKGLEAAGF